MADDPGLRDWVPARDWVERWADFWDSPEGRQIQEREAAEEADLQEWLTGQPDVVVSSHGGECPEQWEGVVDGHRFYFRERGGDWSIELEPRTGVETDRGWDVIAEGSTGAAGYGDSPVQRARFITDLVRVHLTRQACTHEDAELAKLAGAQVRWCPRCGARLTPCS